MFMSVRTWLMAAFFTLGVVACAKADEPPSSRKPTFWVIPHTHWEGAVFKTREEYLEMGLPNIVVALRLLREQKDYRFTLDQVAYVKPFLERYPALEADFRRFLAEGRLQLAGALDVMPDDNMPGGETFIRQMQYGKGYFRDKLGVDVTTGWLLDTFGHHAQIPQLLTLGGYTSFWFFRGVPRQDHPADFLWEGIDGTRIRAFWLPYGYGLLYPTPAENAAFGSLVIDRFKSLAPNARGTDRVGLSGADVSAPEEHLAARVADFNRDPKAPFALKLAVPAEYETASARRSDWPVFRGELNPIFQGIYSSRIELKAWMRTMERALLTAEKLAALARWLGDSVDARMIQSTWDPVLFNQTHDLASGVMTDHVYEDTIRSYEFVHRRAGELIEQYWQAVTSRVDTRGPGAPLLVFNTLGWARTDVAYADVAFAQSGVRDIVLSGPDGDVPSQIIASSRYPDGGLKTARLAFIAREVPALGYGTYHVASSRRDEHPLAARDAAGSAGDLLENEFYRVKLDRKTGAIISLRVKAGEWEALDGPANVVARQQDRGDLWELYKGLDGGSRIAMTTKQSVPSRTDALYSDQGGGDAGTILNGPIVSEFHIARPFGSGRFSTSVRVFTGLRRIDVTTRLVNNEKYVRYQALFPTAIRNGKITHEIPFGAIERPAAIEFPAQNWADYGDGSRGLALLNLGLPGNLASGNTMMLSLLRSHTLGAYGFGGGYEPGMSSETGLQLGQERTMIYALVPHAGDWRAGRVYREGLELIHPLLCRSVLPHAGALPGRWGLLEISDPNVVVSALKPGPAGEIVLRVYEATGNTRSAVRITAKGKLSGAREANLLEDAGAELPADGNAVSIDLHPFQIRTLRLRLAPN
jgi:alpha-mannosidase